MAALFSSKKNYRAEFQNLKKERAEDGYEQEMKRKHDQRHEESQEAFKQQQEQLREKFQSSETKDNLKIGDVFREARTSVSQSISSLFKRNPREEPTPSQAEKEQEQAPSEEAKKAEQAKEEAKATEEAKQAEQAREEQEPAAEEKEAKQEKEVDRRSYSERVSDSLGARKQKIAEKVQKKSPGLYSVSSSVSSRVSHLWNMTFPNYERDAAQKIAERKAQTPVEEEAFDQEEIPERMRYALTVGEEKDFVRRQGLLRKMRNSVGERVRKTESYKKLRASDTYKQYSEFKEDYKDFKENLKDEIDASPNRVVAAGREIYDRATTEKPFARALLKMRARDPGFQIEILKAELPEIVLPLYTEYLVGNLDYLEKVCEDQALGYLKSRIKARANLKVQPKYKMPIYVDEAFFLGGKVGDASQPQFQYSLRVQEIFCNVGLNGKIQEGSDDAIMSSNFRLTVEPHDQPDLQLTGHYWKFVEFEKIEELEMLV